LFDRLDTNRDGRLTPDELTFNRRPRSQVPGATTGSLNAPGAPARAAAPADTRAARLFQRLDADNDGAVSRAEWLAADDTRFDRCDVNKDGRLAFDECRMAQARPTRRPTTVQ
jgi:Ca2+-binding EF-hand superfamily protein